MCGQSWRLPFFSRPVGYITLLQTLKNYEGIKDIYHGMSVKISDLSVPFLWFHFKLLATWSKVILSGACSKVTLSGVHLKDLSPSVFCNGNSSLWQIFPEISRAALCGLACITLSSKELPAPELKGPYELPPPVKGIRSRVHTAAAPFESLLRSPTSEQPISFETTSATLQNAQWRKVKQMQVNALLGQTI